MSQQFVLPGDEIPINSQAESTLTLGPNVVLNSTSNSVHPTTSGLFNIQHDQSQHPVYYVDSNTKRYEPRKGDFVLGVIVGSFGDYYRVSLCDFSSPVILNQFSFPNATKKNRPRLEDGDLIYARVDAIRQNVDAELSCVDATTGKEGGFGKLDGGMVARVKLAYARHLLFNPQCKVLSELVKKCKFEIAIGVNGKVWIKTDDLRSTLACTNIIEESQNWSESLIRSKVEDIFARFTERK